MTNEDTAEYPSLSTEMSQLLDWVVFLNLERMLIDYTSENSVEKLIFKNSTSAGYFMFQLELVIPKWKWNNNKRLCTIKLVENTVTVITERI